MVSYNVTYVSDLKNANQSKTNQTETRTVKLSYSKLPGKLLVNQVQVWKSGLDDLDKATPKTLENPHLFHHCQILQQNDDIAWNRRM